MKKIYRHIDTGIEIKETYFGIYVGKDTQLPKELVEKSRDWFLKEYRVLSFTSPNKEIHSVERLSDGEVFTVGDKLVGGLVIVSIREDSLWVGGVVFICGPDASLSLYADSLVKVPEKSYTPSQLKKIYKELNLDNGKINHSVQRFFNELEKGV